MRKLIVTLLAGLIFSSVFALEVESVYRNSKQNPHYWKNRKPFEGYWQQDVHYMINATINDSEESIEGVESLIYHNNSPDTLYEAYFHLYQNAFTPNSYAHELRKSGKLETVFGEHEANGLGTVINTMKINDKEVQFEVRNTILYVKLPEPLYPNQKAEFFIDFKTYWDKQDQGNMRRRMKTFAHNGYTHFDGVHWYPRISVYDRKFGWTTDQHLGKEFYGDFGQFDVQLTFPNHYIVEATGTLMNREEVMPASLRETIDISNYKTERSMITEPVKPDGSTKTWRYHAINVHDFAFTADPTYRIGEVEWNGIKCIALAMEEHAHNWQQSAGFVAKVIEVYSNDFGPYLYPKIIAADARDGMEYPMLTLDGGTYPGHKSLLAHEIGHNWFFGMVGNNETYRASMDEGFTQFLTAWSMKKIHEADDYNNVYDKYTVFYRYLLHASNENNAILETHSDYFNSAERHGGGYSQVYYKTATMLYNLQYVLGDELFQAAMKNYFDQWKLCHPYWEDFRSSIIRYTKVDLNWFFDQWLNTNKQIDYKVKSVKSKDGNHTITLERKTSMHMPLDIEVKFKDGSSEMHYIPNTYFTKKTDAVVHDAWLGWDDILTEYRFSITTDKKIESVHIDPTNRLADIYKLDNTTKCPSTFKFSNYKQTPGTFEQYHMTWQPNVFYNHIDGFKIGVDISGNYAYYKHMFDATVWYNSQLLATAENLEPYAPISYKFNYKTRVADLVNLDVDSRWLDGANINSIGLTKYKGSMTYKAYFKSLYRNGAFNLNYLLYDNYWNNNLWNNSLNLEVSKAYRYVGGNGSVGLSTRASALYSDYNYARIAIESKNVHEVGKMALKTRVFGQLMTGTPAPESALLLAQGNNEDMMDEPLVRSAGIIPKDLGGFGNDIGNFHYGGGLNLRGYSGYQATNTNGTDTIAVNAGLSGWAINAEWDFMSLLDPFKNINALGLNTYVFADAGILYTNSADMNSGFRMDAGLGTALRISPRYFQNVSPIVIRFDVPLFINRIPPGGSTDYVGFRYVLGISRAF
ncbi:M1 family metallopeptidase [bacterium]|nr:M1 family metallopeptidase [bacterium]